MFLLTSVDFIELLYGIAIFFRFLNWFQSLSCISSDKIHFVKIVKLYFKNKAKSLIFVGTERIQIGLVWCPRLNKRKAPLSFFRG
jgi:hypothetical protein